MCGNYLRKRSGEVVFHKVNAKEVVLLLKLVCDREYLDQHDLSRLSPTRLERVILSIISSTARKKLRNVKWKECSCQRSRGKRPETKSDCPTQWVKSKDHPTQPLGYIQCEVTYVQVQGTVTGVSGTEKVTCLFMTWWNGKLKQALEELSVVIK